VIEKEEADGKFTGKKHIDSPRPVFVQRQFNSLPHPHHSKTYNKQKKESKQKLMWTHIAWDVQYQEL
jgi:hypothetical protein